MGIPFSVGDVDVEEIITGMIVRRLCRREERGLGIVGTEKRRAQLLCTM